MSGHLRAFALLWWRFWPPGAPELCKVTALIYAWPRLISDRAGSDGRETVLPLTPSDHWSSGPYMAHRRQVGGESVLGIAAFRPARRKGDRHIPDVKFGHAAQEFIHTSSPIPLSSKTFQAPAKIGAT